MSNNSHPPPRSIVIHEKKEGNKTLSKLSFETDNLGQYYLAYRTLSPFSTVGPTLSELKQRICNLDEETGRPIEQPPPNYNNARQPPPIPSSLPPNLPKGGKKRKSKATKKATKKSTKKVKQKKYKHKDHYHLSLETKRKCKR